MSETTEQTTLFYRLKLKRTREPIEVFEKMAKAVKKRGATKNWSCEYDKHCFTVYFGDEASEAFIVKFDDKNVCEDFCTVCFPLSGESFDDEKKSEFKSLINMIYSARTSFSEMKITDDFGISESFLDSKVNKIALRELDDSEKERAKRLFDDGHTTVKEFITALLFDLRRLPYSDDFLPYINRNVVQCMPRQPDGELHDYFAAFAESFLYETTEYKKQGRLYDVPEYYQDLNGVFFSVGAFCYYGILGLLGLYSIDKGMDPKSAQVSRLYNNKYLPLADPETDDFTKCLLAYRFFVSILEYLGFVYVGRCDENIDYISDELAAAIKAILASYDRRTYDAFLQAVEKEFGIM